METDLSPSSGDPVHSTPDIKRQSDTPDRISPDLHAEDSEGRSPAHSPHHDSNDGEPAKKGTKDASRPRRKKARRACFACQRAHLTCGDERPCLRCVKRGLQEHCHDGVRKKAKYLHDAPPEVLVPGLGGSYAGNAQQAHDGSQSNDGGRTQFASMDFASTTPAPQFGQSHSPGNPDQKPIDTHQTHVQPEFSNHNQNASMAAPPLPHGQDMNTGGSSSQPFSLPFDPSDPRWYNLDNSGLDFGNTTGRMEYNVLGQMSLGAFGDDPSTMSPLASGSSMGNPYASANDTGYAGKTTYGDFPLLTRHNSGIQMEALPNAFAIGEGTGSIASASPGNTGLDGSMLTGSPLAGPPMTYNNRRSQSDFTGNGAGMHNQNTSHDPFSAPAARRSRRDPSYIYKTVREPYSYTTGFHLLTAFLARRFSKEKTVRIAKALASIRPSFISCTRELSRDDLIFMEQGFQRNLLFLNDYINAYGCPTLICRRTGEIAAVSKEFCLLTGWRKDILLGKEANLNLNYGSSGGNTGASTGTSSRGAAAPNKFTDTESGRPQPVFVAELLDDDTAVQFYDDFAQMAFGDSRGQVQRRGKLLKYKTKNDPGWAQGPDSLDSQHLRLNKPEAKVGRFGSGIDVLGEKDGKVDVMFCHTIRRDFDIPMMIIMNFLPIIP